ncbi:MAG: co-chaperone DjlA [Haliea sp.]|nr:co-chaperone DjlA [Haliea sp.]
MRNLLLVFTLPITLVIGIFGLILGFSIIFFKLLKRITIRGPRSLFKAKAQFLETLFTLLGFLSKADGRVSAYDIARTERLFMQLRLKEDARNKAKYDFKYGAQPGFDPAATTADFTACYGNSEASARMLMLVLINFIIGNGRVDESEETCLYAIGAGLLLRKTDVEQLLRSSMAGAAFRNSQGTASVKEHAKAAYQVLGVKPTASRKEVKTAYKRLVSANHPDKMIAKGMPEQVITQANIKMQEIIGAYESICTDKAWAK